MRPSATCPCAGRPTRTTTCATGPQSYGRCWTTAYASTATSSTRTSRRGRRTRRAWSSCWPSELHDLLDGVAELVVDVEEVRPQPQADIRAAVADDLACRQLAADGLVVGDAHGNRAAAARRVTRGPRLEPVLVEELEQERRLLERALADPGDADLLDHVVACGGGVEGGHVGRPGQEARGAVRVVLPRLEGEGPRMRLPAGERGLERLGQIRSHVEPCSPRPAAEPLDRPADREVDAERGHVQRHGAGRLVRVEHDERALLVGPGDDRLDVLDLTGLVENVGDRHEQRPLVDRLCDPLVVGPDDHP